MFLSQESNLGLLHCRQILYYWATREAQETKNKVVGTKGVAASHVLWNSQPGIEPGPLAMKVQSPNQ